MERFLVWVEGSRDDLRELLGRRSDRAGIRDCIIRQADEVAADISLAAQIAGPGDFRIRRISCLDGDVKVYVQLVFDVLSDRELAVIACRSIEF